MIPLRLEMKNFLPYRAPQPISLEGIRIACLSGDNGAGKSAIFDAITWALWGKARSNKDDDLINREENDMYVQLDFMQEGSPYRVLRRKYRGRSSELNLFSMPEGESPILINETNLRQTQAKIIDLLKLDYETFIHSAFLKQGSADAFTTKRPAERKKILSDILGLEKWAEYEEKAKARLKDIDNNIHISEIKIVEINEELKLEGLYRDDLKAAQADYEIITEEINRAQADLDEISHAPHSLNAALQELNGIDARIKEYEEESAHTQRSINELTQKISDAEIILARKEEIESGYQAHQEASKSQQEITAKLHELQDLNTRSHDLQRQLEARQAELEKQKFAYENEIQSIHSGLNEKLEEELFQLRDQLKELDAQQSQRDAYQETVNALEKERSSRDSSKKLLTATGKAMNERIKNLDELEDANCPLCGQELTEEHKSSVQEQLNTELEEMRSQWRGDEDRIREIDQELDTLKAEIKNLTTAVNTMPALLNRLGALEKSHQDAENAQARLDEIKAQWAILEEKLEKEDFGQDLRSQLESLNLELDKLAYNDDEFESTKAQLSNTAHFVNEHQYLVSARNIIETLHQNVTQSAERLNRLQNAIQNESQKRLDKAADIQTLRELDAEFRLLAEQMRERRTRAANIQSKKSTAEQQIKSLEAQKQRRADIEERLKALRQEQSQYQELKNAFGKNGVPAMIIESAIPELEEEAGDLLSRMTDARMNIKLKTQRQKVSGDMTETLDIEITDTDGTRDYETYSGGEAFRINFALRVALSKMLARRAGAHLRTLFIDEGFGSQDTDGRAKLVDALNRIQDDFDLILVITHIEELRDVFSEHIMVRKTAERGSEVIRS